MRPGSLTSRLLLAVLLAAGVPFAAFTIYVVRVVEHRITESNAEFFLRNKAADAADKLDRAILERRRDLLLWSTEPAAIAALRRPDDEGQRAGLRRTLDVFCRLKVVYDLLLVVDAGGRPLAWNERDAEGQPLRPSMRRRLEGADFYDDPWFRRALRAERPGVDWHQDPLEVEDVTRASDRPQDYSIGFAAPIYDPDSDEILGVWYSLVDWRSIQEEILDQVQFDLGGRPSKGGPFPGGYAFLWDSSAGRILGHKDRSLYGSDVGGAPVNLPGLQRAVRQNPNQVVAYDYPEGTRKRAAFHATLGPGDGGFGWIVGVGVEDEQIFAPVRVVGAILAVGTFAGLAALVLCVLVVSRTITRPLRDLADEAGRVARGDLAARVEPSGPAETTALARAFNHMAADLERSREQLVRAEKEAAWREMARQVSHEIKNPLTPLKLSVQVLERAWRERSPEFESILARAVATVERQVESLRSIASDFRAFAGAPAKRREPVALAALLESVRALYDSLARERRLTIVVRGEPVSVLGDPDELQRALVNLVDNAVHAAPEGSEIALESHRAGGAVRIVVRDQGPGVDPEARGKLFTPYFSTRSQGTGLGLAIVRRIAEDHGGSAHLEAGVEKGTAIVVELPLLDAPPIGGAESQRT